MTMCKQTKIILFNKNQDRIYYEDVNVKAKTKKLYGKKKRKRHKMYHFGDTSGEPLIFTSRISSQKISRSSSLPYLKRKNKKVNASRSLTNHNKKNQPYNSKFIVNVVTENRLSRSINPFVSYRQPVRWRVYRCQFDSPDETCCCSCNSDAMFEVMKSLYDCYKKKNCDNCNCILCGHLPKEERKQGEIRKSAAALDTASIKEKKEKMKSISKELVGKSPIDKEKILRDWAMKGVPLPEGRTPSDKNLIKKVRNDLGLPQMPTTDAEKQNYNNAILNGKIVPLEGKTPAEKEKILRTELDNTLPLPEGRTPSEKALIAKLLAAKPKDIKSKFRKSAAGLDTASIKEKKEKMKSISKELVGKSPIDKEKILRDWAMKGVPLPEGKTPSDKNLIKKVRKDLGLPQMPTTDAEKQKYNDAILNNKIVPLEGKTPDEKEKILRTELDNTLPLPEGRTPSEKALIAKLLAAKPKIQKSAAGLDTASIKEKKEKMKNIEKELEGKSPIDKEKTLRDWAMKGVPLPEGKTPSDKNLVKKVRKDLGLPQMPTTDAEKQIYNDAILNNKIVPLEGKTPDEKEKILRTELDNTLPLPEGRTPSEKALIAKLLAAKPKIQKSVTGSDTASIKEKKEKMKNIDKELEGKSPIDKEKILRDWAMKGVPLPEGKTPSDKNLVKKVRKDLGLPQMPSTDAEKQKYNNAILNNKIVPLEGKTPAEKEKILRTELDNILPLPEGRTPSEKALIAKLLAAKPKIQKSVAGSDTASIKEKKEKMKNIDKELEGKSPTDKEKILRDWAMKGVPLPEGKTPSDKNLVKKVRKDLGLPQMPTTDAEKQKYNDAILNNKIVPLEGKTPDEKEKILRTELDNTLPLPEGRTPSEKALIAKLLAAKPKIQKSVTGSDTASIKEKKEKMKNIDKELEGKSPIDKEKILRDWAMKGVPLPEGKTPSDKNLVKKVRKDLGLPQMPTTVAEKQKYYNAILNNKIVPLEGKTPAEKEKILKTELDNTLPLPEGRTPSEKALIAKLLATKPKDIKSTKSPAKLPSEKLRKAKAEGLLTPLTGKTPEQKEKIFRGLVTNGIPLPVGQTPSDKKLIDKVRKEMGLPPSPIDSAMKTKYDKALADGTITPLEGKTPAQKEKIVKGLAKAGLILPEGRTPSEKSLIKKVKAETGYVTPAAKVVKIPSEKLRKAKAEGLLTPLTGKTPEQKEKILKGLAKLGIPLPEGKTASEKKLLDKVRKDMGLPPSPTSSAMKTKYGKALADGTITPLEGKTPAQKEKILKGLAQAGLPLPEGRTPSEQALVKKVKGETGYVTPAAKLSTKAVKIPSEKLRKAKAAGLLTPLEGKTPEQKEKILKGLAKHGISLPEGKTPSDKKLIDKVKKEMGLPPRTPSTKSKYDRALAQGLITPLEGKTPAEKEKILKRQVEAGLPLPEGRTASEKALIDRIKPVKAEEKPSEKLRKAKAAGLLTPLEGKTPQQKEKIIRDLATAGVPLPEPKTPSEKQLMNKIRKEVGLPPEPTPSIKSKVRKAHLAGLITPLEGKTPQQKEKIIKGLLDAGIPVPEGRTASEKKLIDKVRKEKGLPLKTSSLAAPGVKSSVMKKAKEQGFLTPLEGKSPEQKEKILKGLASLGVPLPEGKSASEKKLIDKVRKDMGLPSPPKAPSKKVAGTGTPTSIPSAKLKAAKAAGLLTPLANKSPEDKERILRGLAMQGLPFPVTETASDKKLTDKVRLDLGMPPEPKSPADQENYKKALAKGQVIPLEGKTPAEKEKILRKLHNQGIELPVGRTPSEKELIAKVMAEPKAVASKKVGVGDALAKRSAGMKAEGVGEEFEEVSKSTTCERACGCDKKKIRFKHSYVKIRVTSPDISSLCPCPVECIPGVKGGVFVDNEGIKITVGSAIGVPWLLVRSASNPNNKCVSSVHHNRNIHSSECNTSLITKKSHSLSSLNNTHIELKRLKRYKSDRNNSQKDFLISKITNFNNYEVTESCECLNINDLRNLNEIYENKIRSKSKDIEMTTSLSSIFLTPNILSKTNQNSLSTLRTESSISHLSKLSNSVGTISIISLHSSGIIPTSSHYLCYPDSLSSSSLDEDDSEYLINQVAEDINPCAHGNVPDSLLNILNRKHVKREPYKRNLLDYKESSYNNPNYQKNNYLQKVYGNEYKPIIIINDLNSNNRSVLKIVEEIMSQQNIISATSSLFVMVATSDEEDAESSNVSESASSTLCIQLSENYFWGNKVPQNVQYNHPSSTVPGIHFRASGKRNIMYDLHSNSSYSRTVDSLNATESNGTKPKSTIRRYATKNETTDTLKSSRAQFSMDTTQDRPCCCKSLGLKQTFSDVVSHVFNPMMLSQGLSPIKKNNSRDNVGGQTSAIYQCQAPPRSACSDILNSGITSEQDPCQERAKERVKFEIKSKLQSPCRPLPRPLPPPQVNEKSCKVRCKKDDCETRVTFPIPKPVTLKSTGCGLSTCEDLMPPGPLDPCVSCPSPIIREEKKMSCLCSGKEKKILIPQSCVCEAISPPDSNTSIPPTKKPCACGDKLAKKGKQGKKETRKKETEKKKRFKNVRCDCPPYVFPSSPSPTNYDNNGPYKTNDPCDGPPEPYCDVSICDLDKFRALALEKIREEWKVQSEMTQTTSGFKIKFNKKRRQQLACETDMSFEDALKFFEENPDYPLNVNYVDEGCTCEEELEKEGQTLSVHQVSETTTGKKAKKKPKKKVDCECPIEGEAEAAERLEEEKKEAAKKNKSKSGKGVKGFGETGDVESLCEEVEDDLKGLKVHMAGKGSNSTGLTGICCFDLIQDSTKRYQSTTV